MSPRRIAWATAGRGANVEPCLLIAGYAHPIVPAGVSFTDVTWSDGADAAWHAATSGITPRGWLDVPSGRENDPPHLAVAERLSVVQGTLDVDPLDVSLTDPDGEATTFVASRDAMPSTPLRETLTAASTGPALVESTSGFDSSGVIYLGREVIAYSGKTSSSFTGLTRARYGTVAQDHRVVSEQIRPSAYGNPPGLVALPGLLGRRATLWLLALDGTTATDPTLVFDGRIGPGASLRDAGWSLPILHALAELGRELRAVPINLTGYNHFGANARGASAVGPSGLGASGPLWLRWGGFTAILNENDTAIDNRGWHATREGFFAAFVRAIGDAALGTLVRASLGADHCVSINVDDTVSSRLEVLAGWSNPPLWTGDEDTVSRYRNADPMPLAWVPLGGKVHLLAGDLAQVPTDPASPAAPSGMVRRYTLGVGEDKDRFAAAVIEVGSDTVTLEPLGGPGVEAPVLTEPGAATVGIYVAHSDWWNAWRYGVLPLVDNLQGINGASDSFDWERITQVASRIGGPFGSTPARQYVLGPGDTFLETLRNELTLSGLSLVTHRGRLSIARIAEVASTETMAARIPKTDLVEGEDPSMVETSDNLATVYAVTIPGAGVLRIVDVAAEDESGPGKAIEADASAVLANGLSLDSLWSAVAMQGMTVLGPFRRPYRVVTIRLPLTYAGVEIGDSATLTEWLLPTGQGTRGLDGAVCVVMGRRLRITEGYVELDLRLSSPDLAGYAPEVLISAIAGAALTVDTSYLGADQRDHGFADDVLADTGAARTDGGASTFVAGDAVQLVEIDAAAPATPFTATVLSVSGTTITLDAAPGATWTSLVGTAGKVMLAFQPYASAGAAQRRYCYVADASTHLVNASARARRYAA